MRLLVFASLFASSLAASPAGAQQQDGGRKAAPGGAPPAEKPVEQPAEQSAEKPVRFRSFPAPDGAPFDVADATARGVEVLLRLPEGDGHDQWPYEGVYREDGGQLPVGYRVGGTSIVCLALIAAPGFARDSARQDTLARGVGFVLQTLDHPRMGKDFIGTYDVRGWGHIYALQLFLHLLDRGLVPAAHATAVAEKTRWLVTALCESAIPETGGWNYARSAGYQDPRSQASTFMTAPALQALFHAKARGYEVADTVLDQALDALERARSLSAGYAYGAPRTSRNDVDEEKLGMMDKVGSSAARATAVETTLLLAGRGDPARLRRAIERFFEHWDDLAVRKSQTGTHIMPFGIAPYYFLYGHLYAAQAIEMLPDDDRPALRGKLLAFLTRSRDGDGSWNDRHFDRSAGYGTAMAILAMRMPWLPAPVARPLPVKKG